MKPHQSLITLLRLGVKKTGALKLKLVTVNIASNTSLLFSFVDGVMVEVTKPDYLSLVNQGGSGFNISELVTAIVGAEIEPRRALQKSVQEKTNRPFLVLVL